MAVAAAESRNDLIRKLWDPAHASFMDRYAEYVREVDPGHPTAEKILSALSEILPETELFTMSSDMLDLVEQAAKTLPPQVLHEVDVPCPSGWLCLPRSWVMKHPTYEGEVPYDFIVWDSNGHDLTVLTFTDRNHYSYTVKEGLPRAVYRDSMAYLFGHVPWNTLDDVGLRKIEVNDLVDYSDRGDGTYDAVLHSGEILRVAPNPLIQFLSTFWHMCSSPLADDDKKREVPRQLRRQYGRSKLPVGPVTVVRLRQRGARTGEGGHWKLSYRYIRRAHWRKQWYGSGGDKYIKHILIAPTVVGPDDAPWREGSVVNVL